MDFILIGGIVLYLLVLRTISSYADQNIRNTLDALLRGAVTIANSEVDRQNREGDMNSLSYQLNTRIRLEDFAREQSVGIIVIADGVVDFATGISEDGARAIAERPGHDAGPGLYAASTHFSPWNWDLVVTKDAIDFQSLVGQVRAVYLRVDARAPRCGCIGVLRAAAVPGSADLRHRRRICDGQVADLSWHCGA